MLTHDIVKDARLACLCRAADQAPGNKKSWDGTFWRTTIAQARQAGVLEVRSTNPADKTAL